MRPQKDADPELCYYLSSQSPNEFIFSISSFMSPSTPRDVRLSEEVDITQSL